MDTPATLVLTKKTGTRDIPKSCITHLLDVQEETDTLIMPVAAHLGDQGNRAADRRADD